MRLKGLVIWMSILILAFLTVPALAAETSGTVDSTSTIITPTPSPGSSFDVPVTVPGANMIVTFTLDNTGQVASVAVVGAPSGATVVTGSEGAKITFQDGGLTKAVDVSVDVETKNGQVVQVKVETEVDHKTEVNKETTETPESVQDQHKTKDENNNSDKQTQENDGNHKADEGKVKAEDHSASAPDLSRREGQNTSGGDSHQADQGDQGDQGAKD